MTFILAITGLVYGILVVCAIYASYLICWEAAALTGSIILIVAYLLWRWLDRLAAMQRRS